MHNRIKLIRNELGLNQKNFANKLGIGQSTLAMIEVGKRSLNERHIKLICSQFTVNEEWLRTGLGNIFNDSDDLYELFGYQINTMTEVEKNFLINFLKLSSEERQLTIKYLKKLID